MEPTADVTPPRMDVASDTIDPTTPPVPSRLDVTVSTIQVTSVPMLSVSEAAQAMRPAGTATAQLTRRLMSSKTAERAPLLETGPVAASPPRRVVIPSSFKRARRPEVGSVPPTRSVRAKLAAARTLAFAVQSPVLVGRMLLVIVPDPRPVWPGRSPLVVVPVVVADEEAGPVLVEPEVVELEITELELEELDELELLPAEVPLLQELAAMRVKLDGTRPDLPAEEKPERTMPLTRPNSAAPLTK